VSGVRLIGGPLPEDVVRSFLVRCRRERAEAGLPEHLEDPDTLRLIAGMVVNGKYAEKKRAHESREAN
jgi:hypothetical protein